MVDLVSSLRTDDRWLRTLAASILCLACLGCPPIPVGTTIYNQLPITNITVPSTVKIGQPFTVHVKYLGSECNPTVAVIGSKLLASGEVDYYISVHTITVDTVQDVTSCKQPGELTTSITPARAGKLKVMFFDVNGEIVPPLREAEAYTTVEN